MLSIMNRIIDGQRSITNSIIDGSLPKLQVLLSFDCHVDQKKYPPNDF